MSPHVEQSVLPVPLAPITHAASTDVVQALVPAVSRLRTPELGEPGLSNASRPPVNSRADGRLDRLTIGPQVTNLPHTLRNNCAEAAGKQISLADRLSQGGLEVREVLRYAIDLAANLAERHRAGAAHGAITAEAVLMTGEAARFQDPRVPGVSATEDAVQFAALLRVMARACDAAERVALGAAFGALSGRYLTAAGGASGRTFKKLVLALKVLRLDYRRHKRAAAPLPARAEIVASADAAMAKQPMAEPSAPRHRKIRILIRAAPPAAEPKRYRRTKPHGLLWRILCSPFLD
jgi:hypothetical protein